MLTLLCLSLIKEMKLKEHVLYFFPGDLCPRCLLSLPSAPAAGGPGCRELLLSATEPACRDEAQEDAHQVEGDGWQVRKFVLAANFFQLCSKVVRKWTQTIYITVSLITQAKSLNIELFFLLWLNGAPGQYCESSPSLLRSDRLLEHVSIALVGKYTKLSDSYTSVIKALEHSALAINHKLEVKVWKHFILLCFVYWFLDLTSLLCSLCVDCCYRTLLKHFPVFIQ